MLSADWNEPARKLELQWQLLHLGQNVILLELSIQQLYGFARSRHSPISLVPDIL